jgi:hypothetical protein
MEVKGHVNTNLRGRVKITPLLQDSWRRVEDT